MHKSLSMARRAYAILEHMKVGRNFRGFTIMETMIVLAISGALFLIAAVALSGKQQHTQFQQAIQDVRSQIQQTVNEVASGFYPNTSNFACSASGAGPVFSAGTTEQGANSDCIFMGKVLQFSVHGTDPEAYISYPIAGLRLKSGSDKLTETFAEAKPVVIAPATGTTGMPDASDTKQLLYGLTTTAMYYGPAKTPIGAVAFVSSMAKYTGSDIATGSHQIDVYPLLGTIRQSTLGDGAKDINDSFASASLPTLVNPSTGVSICFASGGTQQSGLITIGGADRQLSVNLVIKENSTCA